MFFVLELIIRSKNFVAQDFYDCLFKVTDLIFNKLRILSIILTLHYNSHVFNLKVFKFKKSVWKSFHIQIYYIWRQLWNFWINFNGYIWINLAFGKISFHLQYTKDTYLLSSFWYCWIYWENQLIFSLRGRLLDGGAMLDDNVTQQYQIRS